jgi:Na+/phosphate symporter
MDAREFGMAILEYFIANIPTIIALIVVMFNNFKKIKNKVSQFDASVLSTEKNVINKVEEKVGELLDNVEGEIAKVSKSFEEKMSLTIDKVDETLDTIGKQVSGFEDELALLKIKNEHLFKTNKAAFEIISLLISGNEELIQKGLSTRVVNKLSKTKQELEQYPNLISTDEKAFISAVREQFTILGEENFERLIEKALKGNDYGKKTKEKEL